MSLLNIRGNEKSVLAFVVIFIFLFGIPVLGLSAFSSTSTGNASQISSGAVNPAPLFYSAGPAKSPVCSSSALCPFDIQMAYGFTSLFSSGVTGKGQTVVIVDACGDPNITQDLQAFDSQFKLPNPVLNVIDVEGSPTNTKCIQSWSGEVALDVEWSHVTAPSANIDLLVAKNGGAIAMYDAWSYAFEHHLGYQISNSWGGSGCYVARCNNTIGEGIGPCTLTNGTQGVDVTGLLNQAKNLHITMLAASGDGAAYGLGTNSEEGVPGDCTGVLTVGGTQLNVSSSGSYLNEVGWSYSGGGYMTAPKEPGYQLKAEIPDSFGTLAKPDVAADASCASAAWTYIEGNWYPVCGTSLASPLWAGFMADVNQIRGDFGYSPAGYINPFLYNVVYGNPTLYAADFHDITTGNNGWPAGTGWDAVTGLGSFNAPYLAFTLGISESA